MIGRILVDVRARAGCRSHRALGWRVTDVFIRQIFQNPSILLMFDDTDEQRRLADQKRHTDAFGPSPRKGDDYK
jgi:hypothetical protein